MKKTILTLAIIIIGTAGVYAQKFGVRSNALYLGTTTLNLGVDVGLGKKTSLEMTGMYNPFTFSDNKKMKLWGVQPEFRYWTCERFNGHFFGIHAHYGEYNGGIKEYRYEGNLIGGGLTYGYNWVIGKRWNLEAEIGLGYAYLDYDKYYRQKCQGFVEHQTKNYVGPTKIGISFIYFIK